MAWFPFGLALIFSLPLIEAVRRLSIRWGRVAKPRPDRWHQKPTATLGGLGIFGGFALSLAVFGLLEGDLPELPWGILAGASIVFLLGLYDDFKQLSPPTKLLGQILAAAVVVAFGYTTAFFTPRIANELLAQVPNILLTFIWLVGITNAINLLDNMDGLAGGISLITAGILSYFFWEAGETGLLVVSLAMAGSLIAFLVFNFPPASIFMGDSGSLFLGFTLAALAIARRPQASNVLAVMGVPTLLFLLPILDTTLVTVTRLLRGQSPAQGGRDHTSHRLIAFGLNERQAVLALYAIALVAGLSGVAVEALDYWLSLILIPVLVISLALLAAYLGGLKVVVGATEESANRPITRIMLDLTLRRRILEVILDFFLIGIAFYLAFVMDSGFVVTSLMMEQYLQSLPIALVGVYVSFFALGVYRRVWRYVGLDDLLLFIVAAAGGVALFAAGYFLFLPEVEASPVLFPLFAVFLFLGLAASRSSFRILDQFSGQQARNAEQRVLICGADDAGEMALRWILMNPQLDFKPVGFLDRNPFMRGRQIHGVQVLGDLSELPAILEGEKIDGLILTRQEAEQYEILAVCRRSGCWVRSLRLEFEPVD